MAFDFDSSEIDAVLGDSLVADSLGEAEAFTVAPAEQGNDEGGQNVSAAEDSGSQPYTTKDGEFDANRLNRRIDELLGKTPPQETKSGEPKQKGKPSPALRRMMAQNQELKQQLGSLSQSVQQLVDANNQLRAQTQNELNGVRTQVVQTYQQQQEAQRRAQQEANLSGPEKFMADLKQQAINELEGRVAKADYVAQLEAKLAQVEGRLNKRDEQEASIQRYQNARAHVNQLLDKTVLKGVPKDQQSELRDSLAEYVLVGSAAYGEDPKQLLNRLGTTVQKLSSFSGKKQNATPVQVPSATPQRPKMYDVRQRPSLESIQKLGYTDRFEFNRAVSKGLV